MTDNLQKTESKAAFTPCGCMGPMYGEPHCLCEMRRRGLKLNEEARAMEDARAKAQMDRLIESGRLFAADTHNASLSGPAARKGLIMANAPIAAGPLEASVRLSVEETIEDCIGRYPMLFQSRTEVLHHLFVVLGCGYRWDSGALMECYRERVEYRIPVEEAKRLARQVSVIDDPYPWCDLCNLATLPSDALPDWVAAADEIRAAIPALPNAGIHRAAEGRPVE